MTEAELSCLEAALRGTIPTEGSADDLIRKLVAHIRALEAELKQEREPKDGICWYCAKDTNSLHGNPALWPLLLSVDPKQLGVAQVVHTGCVMDRLREAPETEPKP